MSVTNVDSFIRLREGGEAFCKYVDPSHTNSKNESIGFGAQVFSYTLRGMVVIF